MIKMKVSVKAETMFTVSSNLHVALKQRQTSHTFVPMRFLGSHCKLNVHDVYLITSVLSSLKVIVNFLWFDTFLFIDNFIYLGFTSLSTRYRSYHDG